MIRHLLDAAKACIPLQCKSPRASTVEEINKKEDLILTATHRQDKYSKTRTLWNMFRYSDEGQALLDNDTTSDAPPGFPDHATNPLNAISLSRSMNPCTWRPPSTVPSPLSHPLLQYFLSFFHSPIVCLCPFYFSLPLFSNVYCLSLHFQVSNSFIEKGK